jgi:hypothetical protein
LLDLNLGFVLFFGHRDIIEGEKFLLAVSADEAASIDPIELGSESVRRLFAAVGAGQHAASLM